MIKPIFVMHEQDVELWQLEAVFRGIREILDAANAIGLIQVKNFGDWKDPGYLIGSKLQAWKSLEWYLATAKHHSRRENQLDATVILNLCLQEPWQQLQAHYDLIVLRSDIYAGDTNFIIGLAGTNSGAVISIHRFLELDRSNQAECIKTETIHELGHVFGLLPPDRDQDVEFSLGRHCANRCVMRQGLLVPEDWLRITADRLKFGPFCARCASDLRKFFAD